ncbi:PGAP1 family protein [Candidatus Promineifilum breve]|uniref:PGAP1 family protein n=2 Tax=Candidatus Promineifilum breve TaxID=1806508 RepID=A0A160T7V9_9CHLR|nr:PGAP1 family protein [Candidatus Promineifilum breve]
MSVEVIMSKPAHFHPTDLHALARIATDATTGVIDMVETIHGTILPPGVVGAGELRPLTYRALRGAARLLGDGAGLTLAQVGDVLGRRDDSPQRRAVLSALNGLWGDYLDEIDSPLALPMSFQLGEAAEPTGKLAVLVHGLCMNGAGWARADGNGGVVDHGAALARDLGYTPVYLTYNSGLHVSTNGRALATMLDALVGVWPRPVEELVLIGHSMGGLVIRSAGFYGTAADLGWLDRLRAVIFLGTPHHGADWERRGNLLNVMLDATPYAAPFGRLGKRRSAGITDLRYGNIVDEDWLDRDRFAHGPDDRCLVPPLPGVEHYAIAATLGLSTDSLRHRLLGDGLVPLDSALGRHASAERCLTFDEAHRWIGYGMSHLDLLRLPAVYERLVTWLR